MGGDHSGLLSASQSRSDSRRPSWSSGYLSREEELDKVQLNLKYGATNWEVLSLYPSLADAQKENQTKTFTTTASLKQRIKSMDGRYFFLFDAEGKKVMAEVSNEYYQLYTPQTAPIDSFELKFAGTGDFNHLVRIVKP